MSDALVKYQGTTNLAARKIENALAKVRGDLESLQEHNPRYPTPSTEPTYPTRTGPSDESVIDLPRFCAVHDRPYMSRYVLENDGHHEYVGPIRVTQALYQRQYASSMDDPHSVDNEDIGEETCAWCGISGRGSVACGKCKREICYGKTTGDYFRCRKSCSAEGRLVPGARTNRGVVPRLTGR